MAKGIRLYKCAIYCQNIQSAFKMGIEIYTYLYIVLALTFVKSENDLKHAVPRL